MKVFKSKDDTSVLEFHKTYGSFVEFNDKVQEIKDALESQGLSKGLSQAETMLENTAINMLKKGMSVDIVVDCTGLSTSKVKALLKKINQ